ncbi:hypothetical protein [Amycolatopsis panacis]|uniref:Uncharacterized protein n=1 Tax=Amycolatopsis panacis TaxID=2340917 RepID=A0A419HJP8_9PSEU|nr:hypothetical protein [Amycolatopsis panacis]RJQ76068.1 hypothetical protein D5S19_30835 [Amycolatopsis panacis]
MSKRPGLSGRVLVTIAATAVVTGLATPPVSADTAPAVPSMPSVRALAEAPADPAVPPATRVPETTPEEKVEVVRSLGLDIDDGWLGLRDHDFVFKIFDIADPARFPLVKKGALQAFRDAVDAGGLGLSRAC